MSFDKTVQPKRSLETLEELDEVVMKVIIVHVYVDNSKHTNRFFGLYMTIIFLQNIIYAHAKNISAGSKHPIANSGF